jgi:iron complex outermembrane receptor protein
VYKRQELYQNSATNLIDGLKNIPGINQITTGNGISKPVIRGLGYNRVITLFNGIRQEGQQWGDEHGIEIDEYTIGRIEIVKGPGSLMYGSDGIAGVINFITPKILKDSTVHVNIIQNYQSNNQLVAHSVFLSNNVKDLCWGFRISQKIVGNYQNKSDGKIYNSWFRELNGNLSIHLSKKWGSTQLNLNSFNSVINIPTGERDSTGKFLAERVIGTDSILREVASEKLLNRYSIGFPHQRINHIRLLSSTQLNFKKNRNLQLDFGLQKNLRKEYGDILKPQTTDLAFNLTTSNLNLKFNLRDLNNWQSTIGLSSMFQKNKINGFFFILSLIKIS